MENTEWDVFISHAFEDKESFARPLANELRRRGLRVWFDEFTLRVGDSLRRSIDHGLAHSRYGIVILSPSFFAKEWPQKELDGLVAKEVGGTKVILPVWHKITVEEVRKHSPMLAGRLAAKSTSGLKPVATDLILAMELKRDQQSALATTSTETGRPHISKVNAVRLLGIITAIAILALVFVFVSRGFIFSQSSSPVSSPNAAEVMPSPTQQVMITSASTATLTPTMTPTLIPTTQLPSASVPVRTQTATSTTIVRPLPSPTGTPTLAPSATSSRPIRVAIWYESIGTAVPDYSRVYRYSQHIIIVDPLADLQTMRSTVPIFSITQSTNRSKTVDRYGNSELKFNGNISSAVLSPDGSRVLVSFGWENSSNDYGHAIRIMNTDGSNGFDVIRTGPPDPVDVALNAFEEALWSPDGKQIAFRRQHRSDFGVFVINTNGTGLRRLDSSQLEDRPDCWSADGKWIIDWKTAQGFSKGAVALEVNGNRRIPISQLGNTDVFVQAVYPWSVKTVTKDTWFCSSHGVQ